MNEGAFAGWGLREALRRVVDPDVIAGCFRTKKAWKAAGAPTNSEPLHPAVEAAERAQHDLKRSILAGTLVAMGRHGGARCEITPIARAAWDNVRFENFEESR